MITPPPALALPDKVYFRIGEVAELLTIKTHVVRFWQQQFPTVRPERSQTGRFLYSKTTVEQLNLIKHLLYTEGYTIPGARKALRASGKKRRRGATSQDAAPAPTTTTQQQTKAQARQVAADEQAAKERAEKQRAAVVQAKATAESATATARELTEKLAVRTAEIDALERQVRELDALAAALSTAVDDAKAAQVNSEARGRARRAELVTAVTAEVTHTVSESLEATIAEQVVALKTLSDRCEATEVEQKQAEQATLAASARSGRLEQVLRETLTELRGWTAQ